MIQLMTGITVALILTGAGEAQPISSRGDATYDGERLVFTRSVANIEYEVQSLVRLKPNQATRLPEAEGETWYGLIPRRLPGTDPRKSTHFIPFMAEYVLGMVSRAWCDTNLNGDLSDEPAVKLSSYPPREGARSFLASMGWSVPAGSRQIPVEWTIRVILDPLAGGETSPSYRLQMVYGMLGSVPVAGKSHRAFLFDGNSDGLYTKEFSDGFFVDLDDDRHFDMDQMSAEFGSFSVPFEVENRSYEVVSVEPEGREMTLRESGPVQPPQPVKIGQLAPTFSYVDTEGHEVRLESYRGRVVLVYFWSSWCGASLRQAGPLKDLYSRYAKSGLEILGVSYDTDRASMESFRQQHGARWPTSFSGHKFWEDPVGRMYRADGSGMLYLVDQDGRLDSVYTEMDKLTARLSELMPAMLTGSAADR